MLYVNPDDLLEFASQLFVIRTKSGKPTPFVFNRVQRYLHDCLEKQLNEKGVVRSLVLKGRQQGCSTYVQARYFHKVLTLVGKKAFILTHESEATKNIFEITKRYYDNLPFGFASTADKSSTKELKFKKLDSGYTVGTAGNKGAGRSQTIQLFHGSEVAFWAHTDEHATGVLQAISSEPGTEVILETESAISFIKCGSQLFVVRVIIKLFSYRGIGKRITNLHVLVL